MSGRPRNNKHIEMLAEIREFIKERGYAPTIRDLMIVTGCLSTSTVAYYLGKLETLGLIRRDANISRGIVICGEEQSARRVQPKASYEEIAQKKSTGARKAQTEKQVSTGSTTSGPKGESLEDRLDMVVALAKAKEQLGLQVNGKYALHNNLPLFNSGRVRGAKIT